jgi:hypothetical protein
MEGVWGGTTPAERAGIRRLAPEGLARPMLAGRTDRE